MKIKAISKISKMALSEGLQKKLGKIYEFSAMIEMQYKGKVMI